METKSTSKSQKVILIFIALGIWAIVLQNAGLLPTKQTVKVDGGYVNVSGDVQVRGSVDVDNTVDINVSEINGSGSFYDHGGEGKDAEGICPAEASYFVCAISREKSIELGKKYKQNVIVFGASNEVAELIVLEEIL
jgi:hypothetical protein